jgi:predicted small secreted protein
MQVRHLCAIVLVSAATAFAGCTTGEGIAEDEDEGLAQRGPPQCTQRDYSALNMSIRTCVQDFGPATLPEEAQMRNPYVVTVVDTPQGKFSNPLIWSLEVERDGELVIDRRFNDEGSDVQTEAIGERVEIRSAVPLTAEGELEPGTYEIRYRTDDGDEVGTTTITVEPKQEQD